MSLQQESTSRFMAKQIPLLESRFKQISPCARRLFQRVILRQTALTLIRFAIQEWTGVRMPRRSQLHPQDQPLAPNIMRRATNFLSCGRQSSALNPAPRTVLKKGLSLEKSFTSESVKVRPMLLSNRRLLL